MATATYVFLFLLIFLIHGLILFGVAKIFKVKSLTLKQSIIITGASTIVTFIGVIVLQLLFSMFRLQDSMLLMLLSFCITLLAFILFFKKYHTTEKQKIIQIFIIYFIFAKCFGWILAYFGLNVPLQ
jgi:hypothetical protein